MKRSAGISARLCSALTAALLCGCGYHYPALRISRKADFTPILLHQGLADARRETGAAKDRGKARNVQVIRYLAAALSWTPGARLNDQGVRFVLAGRFREAELMFREALKDDPGFAPACNNLAVVYEIFGRRDDSFSMYSRACLIEPGNDVFRENFLNLSDSAVK